MTCIVGWIDDKGIWMGGDSAGVSNFSMEIRADEKVFINEDFIFGFTSSFRMGQLLRYSFIPPKQRKEQSDFAFMCTDFINTVRTCLKEGGYAEIDKNAETAGRFLVGYRHSLYKIDPDYQVGRVLNSFDAVGCGAEIAKGAASVLKTISYYTTKEKVCTALEAAYEYSAGVRPPFNTIFLENKK